MAHHQHLAIENCCSGTQRMDYAMLSVGITAAWTSYGSYYYPTDPIATPRIPQLKLELQLADNSVIGIKIYRALMPTSLGKQLKQFNLFYAAHISLFDL
jgi:hypothetical protein